MSNLTTLEERVQRMLNGEKKRREIAISFINGVRDILVDVAPDIWSEGDSWIHENVIWVTKINKENKKQNTSIYFRWKEHRINGNSEEEGFYSSIEYPVWGKEIEELRGSDFWGAIGVIKDWVPQVIELIDIREKSRQALIDLFK